VIEIRPDGIEQIIQAQFKSSASSEHLTPSRGGSLDSRTGIPSIAPRVVACTKCGSRFAEGVKFCGSCGNRTFHPIGDVAETKTTDRESAPPSPGTVTCPRCKQKFPSAIRFCGKCGISIGAPVLDWRQPRPVEVVCRECGTGYPGGTKFCGRCGKPIRP
jgi:rRNA maturation endonuclease Nob1